MSSRQYKAGLILISCLQNLPLCDRLRSEYLRLQQVLYANVRNYFFNASGEQTAQSWIIGIVVSDYAYESFSWQIGTMHICPLPVESRPTSLSIKSLLNKQISANVIPPQYGDRVS